MLDHIINTRFGFKLIYVILFMCFLFFTAFVITSDIPGDTLLPDREPALNEQQAWSTAPEIKDKMATGSTDETYVRSTIQNDSFTSANFNFSVKDVDALVTFLIETDRIKHSDRIHFLSDNFGQIHPDKSEPYQNKPGK